LGRSTCPREGGGAIGIGRPDVREIAEVFVEDVAGNGGVDLCLAVCLDIPDGIEPYLQIGLGRHLFHHLAPL
jgi:hypothetical protein